MVTSQMMAQTQRWILALTEHQFFPFWKRQKIHCGIIYKGCFGEVLMDTQLFKPCCSNKKAAVEMLESLPISTQEW
jgi:hypothetical protein